MQKAKAEPGEAFIFENGVLQYDGNGDPLVDDVDNNLPSGASGTGERWVGSGRVIYNNKGLPVKQYEPYFTNSPEFEQEDEVREFGVAPLLIYDPLGRNTQTQHPDGSFEKSEWDCWLQKNYDRNDTVADSDWYSHRNSPSPTASEPTDPDERAAWLAVQHHGTPRALHLDVLGRVYKMQDDKGSYDGTSVTHDYVDTEFELDIEGKQRSYTNALGQTTAFTYDMRPPGEEDGGTVMYTDAPDSGERTLLTDAAGKPLMRWDDRGHFFEHSYDDLQRPLGIEMTTGGSTKMLQWMVYGDNIGLSSPEDDNFRGQALRVFDQSGVMETDSVDFKGNLLSGTRILASDYENTIDWTTVSQETTLANVDSQAASKLESESFTTQTEYDALNRPTLVTQPDGSQHKPSYNEAGLLEKMEVQLQHEGSFTEYVENIDYDAMGQRTDIYYGNGSKSRYFYDENTFRLTRLLTTRNTGSDTLQDLNYTYDPVGNIVEIEDSSQQTHYFSNSVITPKGKYEYDALYRLTKATGREKDSLPMPGSGGYTPDFIPTDGQSNETLRTYCEHYDYDVLGNLNFVKHDDTCGSGATTHWKRNYQYNTNTPNNYLLSTYTGGNPPGTPEYSYDNHGNMLEMPHLSALNWDFADQLKSTEKTDETTHYVYSGGERVRKVVMDTSGATDKIKYERIYLGGYELYREYDSSENLDLERETHHVMDDQRKLALLEVKTVNNGSTIPNGSRTTIARYQYTNHLDSACLELNDSAEILSYEEYHPFGTTSYSLHTNDIEVSLKRYKYVHKERDDESALYYYGARYYAPWLCRFVSVDPLKDDYPYLTDYNYAGNKPITHFDIDGMQGTGDDPQEYIVQPGDAPSTIAQENDLTLEELAELNPQFFPKSDSLPNYDDYTGYWIEGQGSIWNIDPGDRLKLQTEQQEVKKKSSTNEKLDIQSDSFEITFNDSKEPEGPFLKASLSLEAGKKLEFGKGLKGYAELSLTIAKMEILIGEKQTFINLTLQAPENSDVEVSAGVSGGKEPLKVGGEIKMTFEAETGELKKTVMSESVGPLRLQAMSDKEHPVLALYFLKGDFNVGSVPAGDLRLKYSLSIENIEVTGLQKGDEITGLKGSRRQIMGHVNQRIYNRFNKNEAQNLLRMLLR